MYPHWCVVNAVKILGSVVKVHQVTQVAMSSHSRHKEHEWAQVLMKGISRHSWAQRI